MSDHKSVLDGGLLSDDDLREWLRGELHRFINIKKTLTRAGLAEASEVNIHTIDAHLSRDPGKWRPLHPNHLLSLCCVMGSRSINGLLAKIGYGGAKPLDEADDLEVNTLVAESLKHMTVIAQAASDGRIDHEERPACQEAADGIIATILPLSSAGEAA